MVITDSMADGRSVIVYIEVTFLRSEVIYCLKDFYCIFVLLGISFLKIVKSQLSCIHIL